MWQWLRMAPLKLRHAPPCHMAPGRDMSRSSLRFVVDDLSSEVRRRGGGKAVEEGLITAGSDKT